MRAITVLRALAWVGVAVAGWSLNLTWGSDPAAGKGPPGPWERYVVGAALLCGVAALLLSVSGRKGAPPGWVPRLAALASAAGATAIALVLRADAASGFTDLVRGPGWPWLATGALLALLAAAGSLLLRRPVSRKKSQGRRRARAR